MAAPRIHTKELDSPSPMTTVLVVDDDKDVRDLCELALREYRVFQADSCKEALRLYKKEHVDLVLSDIMMPGESGIDLLRQVKMLNPNATVIIMTGFMDKEIILNALKEDADDFINKPLNLLQLKTAVKNALGKKALKEELVSIKSSDQLKNAFLSLVSHKLRTPITGISLFLQNLRSGVVDRNDPAFEKSLAMASEETRYLGQLVADLLVFSQAMVNGRAVHKKPGDLAEIVAEVLLKCQEIHCNFDVGIDIDAGALPPVPLDDSKIRFALMQVVDNAFKFSSKPGHVSVRLESDSDNAFVIVSDSGVGIPESELHKVFEKFYQIDPDHTGQIRGFGLGLYYARDYIEQHGGDISLASEPGRGTTVTIRLPLQ